MQIQVVEHFCLHFFPWWYCCFVPNILFGHMWSNYKFNRGNMSIDRRLGIHRTFYTWFNLCFQCSYLYNLLPPLTLRGPSPFYGSDYFFQLFQFVLILLNITLNVLLWELCTFFCTFKTLNPVCYPWLISKLAKFELSPSPLPMGFQTTKLFLIDNRAHIGWVKSIEKGPHLCNHKIDLSLIQNP